MASDPKMVPLHEIRFSEVRPCRNSDPQGELAAAMRYFAQALGEEDPGRKDMLLDIATEELSHLEIIGSIVGMLNKGAKGELAEAVDEEAEMFRKLQGAGNDSHRKCGTQLRRKARPHRARHLHAATPPPRSGLPALLGCSEAPPYPRAPAHRPCRRE